MAKIRTFVIGNENAVLGLALMGVEGKVVTSAREVDEALATALADKSIGILLITSEAATMARERVDALKVGSFTPLVVEVPGQGQAATYRSFREFVQRVVGVNLGGS